MPYPGASGVESGSASSDIPTTYTRNLLHAAHSTAQHSSEIQLLSTSAVFELGSEGERCYMLFNNLSASNIHNQNVSGKKQLKLSAASM